MEYANLGTYLFIIFVPLEQQEPQKKQDTRILNEAAKQTDFSSERTKTKSEYPTHDSKHV